MVSGSRNSFRISFKPLFSGELIITFGLIRSNGSLEILLTVIANSANLWVELKGSAVKMKRKQVLDRAEKWRNNNHTVSMTAEGGSKK